LYQNQQVLARNHQYIKGSRALNHGVHSLWNEGSLKLKIRLKIPNVPYKSWMKYILETDSENLPVLYKN